MELALTHRARTLEGPADLDELVDRARNTAQFNRDHRSITLGGTFFEEDGSWRYNGDKGRLTRHALAQLCSRLELPQGGTVPASYLARCPTPLAIQNLNYWLDRPDQLHRRVLVRTQRWNSESPRVRAVLSERYATVDHLPLLETLQRMVPGHGLTVQAWAVDDDHLTLRLVVGGNHPVSLKDPLRVGLHIANSEIGLARITITGFISRMVCSNGLVVRVGDLGGVQRRHIGRAGESLQAIVQRALTEVLEQADYAARRFVGLRERPAPTPVEQFIERTAKQAELPEEVAPAAIGALEGETMYDVVNAFTQAAQVFPVAERVRIETAMSRFLTNGS